MSNGINVTDSKDSITQKSVFSLALPIFFQFVLSILLGYIDTLMLSGYSQTAVGAIGNANSVLSFLTLAFLVISSATGIMVSQYLGAGKKDEMNKIYTVTVGFNLLLSVVISAVVFFFSMPLLKAMQVPKEMLADADAYMKIVGGTIFTQAIFSVFSQIFTSNGKTVFIMLVALGMNIVNVTGNYLFLHGPLAYLELGARGVAISTSASRVVALVAAVAFFYFVINGRLHPKYIMPFPKDIFKNMLRLGVPSAGENISYECSQLVLTAIVNTMGMVAINTRIYANMLCMLNYMIACAAANATQIIVGHSVGSGNYDFAEKRVLKTLRFSLVLSVGIAVLNFLAASFTFSLFSGDSQVIALGGTVMFVAVFLEFGQTSNIVIINSMKASGDVKFPTALGIASMWGISVLLAFLLGVVFKMGLVGVWIAMAADEIVRGIVVYIRWKKGSWKGKAVVKNTD